MPRFSIASAANLSTCHPDLQVLFFEVIKRVDCSVTCGHRREEAQNEAYDTKQSKVKWPNSMHNKLPSMAADVYFYPINMKDTNKFYWFAGYVLGTAHRLREEGKMTHAVRWGGDWDGDHDLRDQTLYDLCHFELI